MGAAPPGVLSLCGPSQQGFRLEGREKPKPEWSEHGVRRAPALRAVTALSPPGSLAAGGRRAGPALGFRPQVTEDRVCPEASAWGSIHGTTVVEVTSGGAEEADCDHVGSELQGRVVAPVLSLRSLIRARFSSPRAPWVMAAPLPAPAWDASRDRIRTNLKGLSLRVT